MKGTDQGEGIIRKVTAKSKGSRSWYLPILLSINDRPVYIVERRVIVKSDPMPYKEKLFVQTIRNRVMYGAPKKRKM